MRDARPAEKNRLLCSAKINPCFAFSRPGSSGWLPLKKGVVPQLIKGILRQNFASNLIFWEEVCTGT